MGTDYTLYHEQSKTYMRLGKRLCDDRGYDGASDREIASFFWHSSGGSFLLYSEHILGPEKYGVGWAEWVKPDSSLTEAPTSTEKPWPEGRLWDWLVAEDLAGRGVQALRRAGEYQLESDEAR